MKNLAGRKFAELDTMFGDNVVKGHVVEDWYDEDTNDRYLRLNFGWLFEEKVFTEKGFLKRFGIIN